MTNRQQALRHITQEDARGLFFKLRNSSDHNLIKTRVFPLCRLRTSSNDRGSQCVSYTSLEAKTLADRQHRQVQEGHLVHEAPFSAAAGSTEPATRASPSQTPSGASPPGCGCPATPSRRGARRKSRN